MTAEEPKRYINYLVERLEQADLGLHARDAVLQDFLDKQKEYDERLSQGRRIKIIRIKLQYFKL